MGSRNSRNSERTSLLNSGKWRVGKTVPYDFVAETLCCKKISRLIEISVRTRLQRFWSRLISDAKKRRDFYFLLSPGPSLVKKNSASVASFAQIKSPANYSQCIAFLLCTQQPWVWFSAFQRNFLSGNFSLDVAEIYWMLSQLTV